jgi:deoxyribose-phosphate aldolase
MRRSELAGIIDHTCLAPDAGRREIDRLCREAAEYGFKSVCVNPLWVGLAAKLLGGRRPLVCSVVGFPLGATTAKAFETARAVADGADEIDMVIPVGHLKQGSHDVVRRHITEVVEAAAGRPVKVILETCLLERREKVAACRLAVEAGAAWVKTSTGFGAGGATEADVRLMAETAGDRAGVKASGGIRTFEQALAMVKAGAGRLGCSRSVEIVGG